MNEEFFVADVLEESKSILAKAIAEKREKILEEVAEAGIDPRLVKMDISYRTEMRDHSVFLVADIVPRFLNNTVIFGDPK